MSMLSITRTAYAVDCMTGEQIRLRLREGKLIAPQRKLSERVFDAADRAAGRGEMIYADRLWDRAARLAHEGR